MGFLERHYKGLISLLALLLAVGYVHKLCFPHKQENFEWGYYAYENWDTGKMRWTWRRGAMQVTAESDLLGMRVVAQSHNSKGPEGLTFDVSVDGDLLDSVWLVDGGSRYLYWYVPSIKGKEIEIETNVNRTFKPFDLGINEDGRELGVAVSPVWFLRIMPREGVGFYWWEKTDVGGQTTDDGRLRFSRFRWTGKRASVPIAESSKLKAQSKGGGKGGGRRAEDGGRMTEDGGQRTEGGIEVFLRCAHPGIDKEPVVVKVFGDGAVLRYLEFKDYGWKRVEIGAEELKGKEIITYEVSRTWNPKRMGVSGDWRDLGVAVGF